LTAPAWPEGVDPPIPLAVPKLTKLSAEAAPTQRKLAVVSRSKRVRCFMVTVLVRDCLSKAELHSPTATTQTGDQAIKSLVLTYTSSWLGTESQA
jgi:hypothetical protein